MTGKPTILVVPDLFYHRWDTPEGELWLSLRPFILVAGVSDANPLGDLADFDAFAQSPETSAAFQYADTLPQPMANCRLDPSLRLAPINLPSDLDVWVQTIRGPADPAPWTRISRSAGCLTTPDQLKSKAEGQLGSQPLHGAAANPWAPFAHWFNKSIADRWAADDAEKRKTLSHWLELRLESGDLVEWTCEQEIRELYRNEADPGRPPLPLFSPEGPWIEGPAPGRPLATNLFWLSGLMIPLGRKDYLAQLQTISAVHIRLAPNTVPAGTTSLPDAQAVFRTDVPRLDPGQPPQPPYFSTIQPSFDVRLESRLEPRQKLVNGQSWDANTVYVSPALRGFAKAPKAPRGWSLPAEKLRPADESDGYLDAAGQPVAPESLRTPPPRLADLAGLEVRVEEGPDALALDKLALLPGIIVSGRVRTYRRFPMLKGPGARRPTVTVFEPAPGGAPLLAEIERVLGRPALAEMLASARLDADWTLQLLASDPLPWDGPEPVYRVLAAPKSSTAVGPDDLRTLAGAQVTLTRASLTPLVTGRRDKIDPAKPRVRWTWRPDDAVDKTGLAADWAARDAKWAQLPFNALFLGNGVTASGTPEPSGDILASGSPLLPGASIDALVLGDYAFHLADHRGRLDKRLAVTSMGNDLPLDTAACRLMEPPAQDYADDLVNFTVARILAPDGKAIDDRIRFVQEKADLPDPTHHLHRKQYIPLQLEWGRDPLDQVKRAPGEQPNPAAVTWQEIRQFVDRLYLSKLAIEPFRVQLAHTLGARQLAASPLGPLSFARSDTFGWPLEMPTAAELAETAAGAAQPSPRFLTCRYDAALDQIVLTFDARVLDPAQLATTFKIKPSAAYTLALTAWRSLAEMVAAGGFGVQVQTRTFDVANVVPDSIAAAKDLAAQGAPKGWIPFLTAKAIPVSVPPSVQSQVTAWARGLFGGGPLSAPPAARIPMTGSAAHLGQQAHIVRAELVIARTAAAAPPADLVLVPSTLAAGDRETSSPTSLMNVWAQMGFGPFKSRPSADIEALGGARLAAALAAWRSRSTSDTDSITPDLPTATATTRDRDGPALIAELEGTDWFAPPGRPSGDGRDVRPIIMPLGFAACAPHPKLDRSSQPVLERALGLLSDFVDLAYADWANADTDWAEVFRKIVALATWNGNDWTGPLPDLIGALVDQLLLPEPHETSGTVDPDVQALVRAYRRTSPDSQVWHLRAAARRLLLEHPGVYADSKALLLTQLQFVKSAAAASPPPETLARARFSRRVRPASAAAGAAREVQSLLSWQDLVAASPTAVSDIATRLGFLETLDDAQYDNAFQVRADSCAADPFEEMIDPPAPGETRLAWGRLPPCVPSHDENAQPAAAPREVRLASRNLVVPPELLWAGASASLDAAVAGLAPGQHGWRVELLKQGLGPASAAAPDELTVAAMRAAGPWAKPLTADQRLVHFVYRVSGDEEANGVDDFDAFANDGFFVRVARGAIGLGAPPNLSFPSLSDQDEKDLLGLLQIPRASGVPKPGKPDASPHPLLPTTLTPMLLSNLKGLVQRYASAALPSDAVLMRPHKPDASPGGICVGSQPAGASSEPLVRNVVLFRPTANTTETAPDSSAYLVFSLALDVWSEWRAQLFQGRNLPYAALGSTCEGAGGRVPAQFASEFWQAVPQLSAPVALNVDNKLRNTPLHWRDPKHVFVVPKDWVGQRITVAKLMDRLLFKERLIVGDEAPDAPSLINPANANRIYGYRLVVTTYQEQFEGGADRPRDLRYPFPSVECRSQTDAATNGAVWFPEEYASVSLDIHWFRDTGADPLLLYRIFAQLP